MIHSEQQPNSFLLMRAAREGNVNRISALLLRASPRCASDSSEGWTPLHEACRRGHYRVVQELLRHGLSCNLPDRFGRTPFLVACDNSCPAVVQLLLERGIDPNQSSQFSGDTALHRVCLGTCNLGIAQRLLDAGADMNRPNKLQETVLQSLGDTTVSLKYDLDLLFGKYSGQIMLERVLQYFHLEPAEQCFLLHLAEYGPSTNLEQLLSSETTNLSMVSMLSRKEKGGKTIIEFIRDMYGRTEADPFYRICARSFLRKALQCPAQRLRSASSRGNIQEFLQAQEVLRSELEKKGQAKRNLNAAAANQSGLTPLHCACLYGQENVVALLLDGGADLWAQTESGQTPLGLASRAEHLHVVQAILLRLLC